MGKKLVVPLLTAVTVAALLGVIVFVVHLRDDDVTTDPAPAPRLAAVTTGEGGEVRLMGRLPAGEAPRQSRVFSDGRADADTVRALAHALGLDGVPRAGARAWTVDDGERRLTVSHDSGWRWQLSGGPEYPGGPSCPRDEPGTTSSCAGSGAEPPDGPAPEPEAALAATADLRRLLSLEDAVLVDTPQQYPDARRDLTLAPRVAGLPTWGVETRFGVGRDGKVYRASGVLARPAAGDVYPVIGVDEAVRRLRENPGPVLDICRVDPNDRAGGCLPPDPVEVTGADAGLARTIDERGVTVLAPAWLLRRAGHAPVPVLAVSDRYLIEDRVPVGPSATLGPDTGEGRSGAASAAPPAEPLRPSPTVTGSP